MSEPKLRLLKVLVQPIYVLDDGEHLTEQIAEPITIAARAWPTWAARDPLDWLSPGVADTLSPAGPERSGG